MGRVAVWREQALKAGGKVLVLSSGRKGGESTLPVSMELTSWLPREKCSEQAHEKHHAKEMT